MISSSPLDHATSLKGSTAPNHLPFSTTLRVSISEESNSTVTVMTGTADDKIT